MGVGLGGTGPAMQVGKGVERQHPEQADLGGAFRTQGRNEPVVGSGNCSRKRKSGCVHWSQVDNGLWKVKQRD